MNYLKAKKQLVRDSLIVIPTMLLIAAWLFVQLNPNIDLAPGAGYGRSVLVNLLLPLAVLGIAQMIYALVLMIDCIRLQGKSKTGKIFICIGIWFAVMYLFFAVYVYRLIRFLVFKTTMQKTNDPAVDGMADA